MANVANHDYSYDDADPVASQKKMGRRSRRDSFARKGKRRHLPHPARDLCSPVATLYSGWNKMQIGEGVEMIFWL